MWFVEQTARRFDRICKRVNVMGIYYKQDICELLRKAGYTSYVLHTKGILTSAGWTRLQQKKIMTMDTLDKICTILQMQPGELIGYKEE